MSSISSRCRASAALTGSSQSTGSSSRFAYTCSLLALPARRPSASASSHASSSSSRFISSYLADSTQRSIGELPAFTLQSSRKKSKKAWDHLLDPSRSSVGLPPEGYSPFEGEGMLGVALSYREIGLALKLQEFWMNFWEIEREYLKLPEWERRKLGDLPECFAKGVTWAHDLADVKTRDGMKSGAQKKATTKITSSTSLLTSRQVNAFPDSKDTLRSLTIPVVNTRKPAVKRSGIPASTITQSTPAAPSLTFPLTTMAQAVHFSESASASDLSSSSITPPLASSSTHTTPVALCLAFGSADSKSSPHPETTFTPLPINSQSKSSSVDGILSSIDASQAGDGFETLVFDNAFDDSSFAEIHSEPPSAVSQDLLPISEEPYFNEPQHSEDLSSLFDDLHEQLRSPTPLSDAVKLLQEEDEPTSLESPSYYDRIRHISTPLNESEVRLLQENAAFLAAGGDSGEQSGTERGIDSVTQATLSLEQKNVLDAVMRGENVFFTGAAGTGKSFLLKKIIEYLRNPEVPTLSGSSARTSTDPASPKKGFSYITLRGEELSLTPKKVAITATTGIAASHIGGMTLHSFAGVGLGNDTFARMISKFYVKHWAGKKALWTATDVLIVDEVSMLHPSYFGILDRVARVLRQQPDQPFGGMQMVFSGDFFQLPPVFNREDRAKQLEAREENPSSDMAKTFAFETNIWKETFHPENHFNLQQVYRQKDKEFVDVLNRMRWGQITFQDEVYLRTLSREVEYVRGAPPTKLFPRRFDVEVENYKHLSALTGDTKTFTASDSWCIDLAAEKAKTKANSKLHAMLDMPLSKILDESTRAPNKLDLKVGTSVMYIQNEKEGPLVNGLQGTVAGFEKIGIKVYFKGYPEPLTISANEFTFEDTTGKKYAARLQVPLILSHAITIHKSQGQQIERLKVDLKDCFDYGQVYVAISRATDPKSLEIRGFMRNKIKAHPTVVSWYKNFKPIIAEQSEPRVIDLIQQQPLPQVALAA